MLKYSVYLLDATRQLLDVLDLAVHHLDNVGEALVGDDRFDITAMLENST